MLADTAPDQPLSSPSSRPPWLRRLAPREWRFSRRIGIALLVLLALAPVFYVMARTAEARRNVVYWDEFDTALVLMLKLKSGTSATQFLEDMFAVSNEHRMVTSRMMFAASYWLTGTINFTFVSLVGNASIIALCVLLVISAGTTARRLRLGVLLAALIFQLEHYENFLWSGSSIDHFQIVLLVGAAIVGLARGTRGGVLAAGLFAILATFTLAHGILAWPVGAAMLWRTHRRRALTFWCVLGATAIGGFLTGFELNHAQQFASASSAGALKIIVYWLALLGAVPALGFKLAAPWLGGLLLLGFVWLACRGALRREPIAFPLAVYAVAALALIALGRAEESGGQTFSRYYVLSALAWALAAFMALERFSHPRRPLQLLARAVPLLIMFNLAANALFSHSADSWLECRDRAVLRFKQHGVDGRGPFTLHPAPAHSTALLNEAERLGVYRMGPVCLPRKFPNAQPSTRIMYFVDELTVSPRSAYIAGWAAIPDVKSERGDVHVVLRSETETHIYTTVTVTRPDVAESTKQPGWVLSGFRFARLRDRLPTGEFQLGILIKRGGQEEYVMTAHRLHLVGEGKALLATGD